MNMSSKQKNKKLVPLGQKVTKQNKTKQNIPRSRRESSKTKHTTGGRTWRHIVGVSQTRQRRKKADHHKNERDIPS